VRAWRLQALRACVREKHGEGLALLFSAVWYRQGMCKGDACARRSFANEAADSNQFWVSFFPQGGADRVCAKGVRAHAAVSLTKWRAATSSGYFSSRRVAQTGHAKRRRAFCGGFRFRRRGARAEGENKSARFLLDARKKTWRRATSGLSAVDGGMKKSAPLFLHMRQKIEGGAMRVLSSAKNRGGRSAPFFTGRRPPATGRPGS
jgi:hypothetical protein